MSEDCVSRVLQLHRNGHVLNANDDALQEIGELFVRQVVIDPEGAARLCHAPLLAARECPYLTYGLLDVLEFKATNAELRLQVNPLFSICNLPSPVESPDRRGNAIGAFVHQNHHGQFVLNRVPPSVVVAAIATSFPQSRFIVLGNSEEELQSLRCSLRRLNISCDVLSGKLPLHLPESADEESVPRLLLSTLSGTAVNVPFERSDIVLLLDAYDCIRQDFIDRLSSDACVFRLFGIVRPRRHASPAELDRAIAAFGPSILHVGLREEVLLPIHVAIERTPGKRISQPHRHNASPFDVIWNHCGRTNQIARLASSLASGDYSQLPVGPTQQWARSRAEAPLSVTVLVDRPVHAQYLSERLTDWQIVISESQLVGLPGSFANRVRRNYRAFTCPHLIFLVDCLSKHVTFSSDVVIWAAGGRDLPPIPLPFARNSVTGRRPQLVIDFDDRHNAKSWEMSLHRQAKYAMNDVYPPGISIVNGRVAAFLKNQPKLEVV